MSITTANAYRVTTPIRSNAKTWAKKFSARMLEPGIVSYEDQGCGKAFITKETIERSMESFIGCPLILTPKLRHKKVTPKDLEKEARGYITGWHYAEDGWFWVDGICHDDDAKEAINRVGLCSCAYEVTKVGTGGDYHAIPYDEEILAFSGEHLAIVDKPRYGGATIRLNSKNNTTMIIPSFKWIRNKIAGSRQNSTEPTAAEKAASDKIAADKLAEETKSRENSAPAGAVEDISGDTEIEIPTAEGKTAKVAISKLVDAYNSMSDTVTETDSVEIDGKPVTVGDLVKAYKANSFPPTDEDEKKKKERENAEEKEKKDAEEKKGRENAAPAKPVGTNFRVLMNARNQGEVLENSGGKPDDLMSRVERGNASYGPIAAK